MAVRKSTKANKNGEIYFTLRDDIIHGKYPGGTFLVEGDLCDQFNVSRTPVREALIRLENDQFIKLIPNRGAYVPHMTINDIVELYQIRKVSDGLATYLSVERQTPNLVAALEESVAREEKLVQAADDPATTSNEDFAFHSLLRTQCGNHRLTTLIDQLENQMKRATTLSIDQYAFETLTISLGYHKMIVEAFHENDCAKARQAIEDHWAAMIDGFIRRDLLGRLPSIL